MKRKVLVLCALIVCVMALSACKEQLVSIISEGKEQVVSRNEMRERALACFEEYKGDMEEIVASQSEIGDLDWGENYSLQGDGSYDFILVQEGFTKAYIRSGVRYCPDDKPSSNFEWKEKDGTYSYENGSESYYMERIEKHWFFFYSKYDV